MVVLKCLSTTEKMSKDYHDSMLANAKLVAHLMSTILTMTTNHQNVMADFWKMHFSKLDRNDDGDTADYGDNVVSHYRFYDCCLFAYCCLDLFSIRVALSRGTVSST